MKFNVPGKDVTLDLNPRHFGITKDGVADHCDISRELSVIKAVASAVAGASAFAALTSVGVPPVISAGVCAAARPLVNVDGYYRDNGTYVRGHNRTHPDCIEANNFSA